MIDGVKTKTLRVIPDERGRLMEMLRADDGLFMGFGQIYMPTAFPGAVKAWHYRKKQTDNFVCGKGIMKIVLDDEEGLEKTVQWYLENADRWQRIKSGAYREFYSLHYGGQLS